MQQGRKSSSGQGLPHRAAEEQATKRGRKRVRKGFQGRISLSPLFAFFAWAVLHSVRCGRCQATVAVWGRRARRPRRRDPETREGETRQERGERRKRNGSSVKRKDARLKGKDIFIEIYILVQGPVAARKWLCV